MVPLPSYNYERTANLKFGAESVKEEEGDIMLQILLTFTPTDSCKSGVHSVSNKLSARCINPMIQSFPDCGCTNNIKLELPSNFLECQENGGLFRVLVPDLMHRTTAPQLSLSKSERKRGARSSERIRSQRWMDQLNMGLELFLFSGASE